MFGGDRYEALKRVDAVPERIARATIANGYDGVVIDQLAERSANRPDEFRVVAASMFWRRAHQLGEGHWPVVMRQHLKQASL
jgi:hypothetical protein